MSIPIHIVYVKDKSKQTSVGLAEPNIPAEKQAGFYPASLTNYPQNSQLNSESTVAGGDA